MSYNPDQPRVPAGKSTGGQWTSAAGAARGAAGVGKTRVKYTTISTAKLSEDDRYEASAWFDGYAGELYDQALANVKEAGSPPPVLIMDENEEPMAFYQGRFLQPPRAEDFGDDFDEDEAIWLDFADKAFYIDYLGSGVRGGGTAALMEAAKEALRKGATMLMLESIPESMGFYEKVGMSHMTGMGDSFWWSNDDMQEIIDEYFSRGVQ